MSKGDKKKKKEHKRKRDEEDNDWSRHQGNTEDDREQRKARKKSEKIAKMLGYSDDINPFGDSNLLQPFVWGKKKEKEKYDDKKIIEDDPEKSRLKLIAEIEKVRQRRIDRENELAEIARLRDEEQRLREASQYGDWQQKEEEFHLEQVKQRSKIRLVENREKPVDLIAKNLLILEAVDTSGVGVGCLEKSKELDLMCLESELRNPVEVVETLSNEDLDDLLVDVDSYIQLEQQKKGKYLLFWESVRLLVLEEKTDRNNNKNNNNSSSSVLSEIRQLLVGKTSSELESLQSDIEKSLREGRVKDVEYWETLGREIRRQQSICLVTDIHVTLCQRQALLLTDLRQQHQSQLQEQRRLKANNASIPVSVIRQEEDLSEMIMEASDEVLLLTSQKDKDMSSQMGKYQPRKPRYLNRVKTGWDWNKYNQTHYDFDNPPPKVVQGYKFTVFYPDLVDVYSTPRYVMEPCVEEDGVVSKQFVIIRFTAGAPYEDIAFKIVNKEWDVDKRSGFRSMFEKGVLQLHFNFKRTFYRR